MINHILYLSDKKTICDEPNRLGNDFVISSSAFGQSCKECSSLLFAHNKNEFAKEYNYGVMYINDKVSLLSTRGAIVGTLVFSSIFWLSFMLTAWLVWFRG